MRDIPQELHTPLIIESEMLFFYIKLITKNFKYHFVQYMLVEFSVYLIAFLLLLAPVSAVCVTIIDNKAIDEYSRTLSYYELKIRALEDEIEGLKKQDTIPQQRYQTPEQPSPTAIAPLLPSIASNPDMLNGLLAAITGGLPEKDPALLKLATSGSMNDLIWSSILALLSITINLAQFVVTNFDVVIDFTRNLISYGASTFLGFLASGEFLTSITEGLPRVVSGIFIAMPLIIASIPRIGTIVIETLRYMPEFLVYISIIFRNLPLFFAFLTVKSVRIIGI